MIEYLVVFTVTYMAICCISCTLASMIVHKGGDLDREALP
jgi:hypothetical protein